MALSSKARIRAKLARRQGGWFCCWCSRKVREDVPENCDSRATIEHLLPRKLGGSDSMRNYALACRGCNTRRGHQVEAAPSDAAVLPVAAVPVLARPPDGNNTHRTRRS